MFSDTHFHLHHIVEERHEDGKLLFETLASRDTPFLLEIGTHCDDLPIRYNLAQKLIDSMESGEFGETMESGKTIPTSEVISTVGAISPAEIILPVADYKTRIRNALHFSAGIWPAPEAIKDRFNQVIELERQINAFQKSDSDIPLLCALGECGLDHHWNVDGVDNRDEASFNQELLNGEAELFCLQLELARKLKLPVIVHSRDAFDGTYGCIKETGYNCGIIHCYSYGIEEARAFLDLGWYISFSGSITYTKKSKMDSIRELLNYIPKDRLLLETDAPYLAPVPIRGKCNTPLYIEYTYHFAAEALNMTAEQLAHLVTVNATSLFKRQK